MICYKDMTFCSFYADCKKAYDCNRPITPHVEEAARSMGLPIAQFAEKPDCHSDNTSDAA